MRNTLTLFSFAALLVCATPVRAQDSSPAQPQTPPAASSPSSSQPSQPGQAGAQQTDSLAEAARKARAAKGDAPKPPKVYTNDDLPSSGGVSSVGSSSGDSSDSSSASSGSSSGSNGSYPDGKDEKAWRALFASLQHKLEQDQQLLEIDQRELGEMGPQYYADPQKTMMQELTREDLNKKTASIEKRKKDVAADKQAIEDAQDALRRAGGDVGWAGR